MVKKIFGWCHQYGKENQVGYNLQPFQYIKLSMELLGNDGSIPYLDTMVLPNKDDSIQMSVNSKPTHIDHFLDLDLNHSILP